MISAESVKAKLKKEADSESKDFNYVLMHYFIERLLYRLSVSPYVGNFILKGGLLLYTFLDNRGRATRDVDFLARQIKNTPEEMTRIFTEIAKIPCDDAVYFETERIAVERIKEDADYPGVRIKLTAYLDRSRHNLQFDIGFDDVIIPAPVDMTYPSLLDMEPPRLKVYSLESVIAEKFHAMVYLADLNSRMKDFYDIYELSRSFSFDGASLSEAISQTFKRRNTEFSAIPMIFTDDFSLSSNKQIQWQAFQCRVGIADVPIDFPIVMAGIKKFLLPVYEALFKQGLYIGKWDNNVGIW
ncbi:MAG: nucleotidyl transferase AbiEii/AbiGii toxin family protein [Spirochaetia bacterium]|jgi:predicted nucleotidyltransferase component of viral defense system|nr:nucleotidyl transferase AbiEii/AbiGii toxin family protein [Spirochaetia bacterium]